MLIHFTQSTYFKANKNVDRYLLENYLLPGLEKQGVIASGSRGVELPIGKDQEPEYLTLEETKYLILDWLAQTHNLLESDKRKLANLKNYEQFASLVTNIYESRIQDPDKLLTAARLQNIADFRASQKIDSTGQKPQYDPGKAIDDYNRLYLKILSYSRLGLPHNLLQQIVSSGTPSYAGGVRETTLASIISANLSRLHAAGSMGTSDEAQDYAVAHELGKIIRSSYPGMSDLLNVLGEKQTASDLRKVTEELKTALSSEATLETYEKSQIAAVSSTDDYFLSESELRGKIYNALPLINERERVQLTNSILKELVSSSPKKISSEEMIGLVGQKMSIPQAELIAIQRSLRDSGLSLSLEYRQNELSVLVGSHHLTAGERGLLNKGINPFLVHSSAEKVRSNGDRFLSEYNAGRPQNQQFPTLQAAHENEKLSQNPNVEFLRKSRSYLDQLATYDNLTTQEKSLVNRSRFGRWITDTRSRFYETQSRFFDKWIDIEETLTGKKALHKLLDNWDAIAEKITIPGTKIPFFRMVPWIYDRIDEWKKVNTLKIISRTSSSSSWFGKSINWTFKQYELGGFTVNGATAHFATAQWGKLVKWSLTKTGMSGVVKYAGISTSRTATRFLIKLGGKALARLGEKAIGAIITAGTAIGSVLFAIGMVWDLATLAWNFVKEFINNIEFRKTVRNWAIGLWAFFSGIQLAPLAAVLGVMFAVAFEGLLLSLIIVGTALFVVPQIIDRNKSGTHLDAVNNAAQIIANIVCTLGGAEAPGTSSNPRLAAGKCVYKLLTEAGINPLNSSNAAGPAFTSFSTGLGNGAAASEAQRSAQKYGAFQCVGFDVVVSMMTGGGGAFSDANLLDSIEPASYKFVAGVGSCSPGDFFVDKNGSFGHTGLYVAPAGANIVCMDANSDGRGTVRDDSTCRWPTNNIAGCLKRN